MVVLAFPWYYQQAFYFHLIASSVDLIIDHLVVVMVMMMINIRVVIINYLRILSYTCNATRSNADGVIVASFDVSSNYDISLVLVMVVMMMVIVNLFLVWLLTLYL